MITTVATAITAVFGLTTAALPYLPDIISRREMVEYFGQEITKIQLADKTAQQTIASRIDMIGRRLLTVDQRVIEGQLAAARRELVEYQLKLQDGQPDPLIRARVEKLKAQIQDMTDELKQLACEGAATNGGFAAGCH